MDGCALYCIALHYFAGCEKSCMFLSLSLSLSLSLGCLLNSVSGLGGMLDLEV